MFRRVLYYIRHRGIYNRLYNPVAVRHWQARESLSAHVLVTIASVTSRELIICKPMYVSIACHLLRIEYE